MFSRVGGGAYQAYEVDPLRGALVIVRPDGYIGMISPLDDVSEVNEYFASLRDKYPTQFGFFAALPSALNTDSCIDEIRYAMDVLKADGVGLMTSYNDKYLGHPDFEGFDVIQTLAASKPATE